MAGLGVCKWGHCSLHWVKEHPGVIGTARRAAATGQSPGLDAFTSFYVILYAILYAILYVRFTQGLDASTQGLDASTLPWSDSMLRQRKG